MQLWGILRLELRRNLFSRRISFVLLLGIAFVLLVSLRAIFPIEGRFVESLGGIGVLYAIVFRGFFLRLALFFACVGVFTRLFRGDVLERTLHYYFLTPVRYEVLVAGKYLAGVIITTLVLGASTVCSFLLAFAPSGLAAVEDFLLNGPGLGQLFAYLGITVLACMGYGAIFLLMGLFFRNPIVPAGVVLGWEYINFLLPPLLKKISVIYYLESLCPVPIPEGPVALLADPAPFWLAVPGMFGVVLISLALAAFRVRLMEISYAGD
jgi:ABC-type transport system involved in cytochrome c biogenesis permease component